MHQEFELKGRELVEVPTGTVTVAFSPTPAEHAHLRDVLGIDEHNLNSALDPEEISHLEFGPNGRTTIIWKRPDPPADADASGSRWRRSGTSSSPGGSLSSSPGARLPSAGGSPSCSRPPS
jgi:hypothetical protein